VETLFGPLEGLNVAQLYDKYHSGIDLFLYMFVLVVACRAALARMFPDQYGRRLGTAVGVVLAISLAAVEHTLGFSIRSFGPIAAGLLILMVALVVYSMMRRVGADHAASSSTALIVTYFSMRAVMPGFFLWAQENQWANYLHSLLVLSILIALWRVIHVLFSSHDMSAVKRAVQKVSENSRGFIDVSRKQDTREWGVVQNQLRTLTLTGKRECKKVIKILEEIMHHIRQGGSDKQVAEAVCKALNDLKAREHILISELARIQAVDAQLVRLDLNQYKNLKREYQRMSRPQQAECKRMFSEERQKLGAEQAIQKFAARAEAYAVQFDRCVDSACQCLEAGRAKDSEGWVEKAVEQEREAEKLIDDMRKQEKWLLRLLEKQVVELRSASKK